MAVEYVVAEILQQIAWDKKFLLIRPVNQPLKSYFQKSSRKILWAMLDQKIDDEKFPAGTVFDKVCAITSACRSTFFLSLQQNTISGIDGISSGKRGMCYEMDWTANEHEKCMEVVMTKPTASSGYPGGDEEVYKYQKTMIPNLEEPFQQPYTSPNGNVTVNMHPERLHITGDRKFVNKSAGMEGCGGLSDVNLVYQVGLSVVLGEENTDWQ